MARINSSVLQCGNKHMALRAPSRCASARDMGFKFDEPLLLGLSY